MSRRTHTALSVVLGVGLYLAHHLLWAPPREAPRLVLGWIPEELALRLAWMAAAFLFLLHLTTKVWRPEEEA